MESIFSYFDTVSDWLRAHQEFSVTAVTAAVLVLGGSFVNRSVKRLFSSNHFLIRTVVFILLCSLGYGILATWLDWGLSSLMHHIDNPYYGPVVILIFIAIGILAERK